MVCRISWKRGVAALVFLAAAALCLILAMSSCQKSGGGAEAPVVTGFGMMSPSPTGTWRSPAISPG